MASSKERGFSQFIHWKKYFEKNNGQQKLYSRCRRHYRWYIHVGRYLYTCFKKICLYDIKLSINEINFDLLEDLEKLEPFGNGNEQPMFITENIDEFRKFTDHNKIINMHLSLLPKYKV